MPDRSTTPAARCAGTADAARTRARLLASRLWTACGALLLLALAAATASRTTAQGAPATHWAFAPLPARIASPPAPAGTPAEADHPVDRFVRARGGVLAPRAPHARLLRRAHLTLTGLPPTLAELESFEREAARDGFDRAFERVLDRLFASPRYGEHMAVHWLDLARYADTHGYQSDVERPVWPWRDWVVGSFADNVPYDEFVRAQIAGDLLPDAGRDDVLATCFNRLHRQTNEGGSVEDEFRKEYVADRVDTFGTVFLGLTLGCARCHDHKFDPVSQAEYYALSAFFDNIDESGLYSHFTRATPTPALALPTPAQEAEIARTARQRDAAEAELARVLDERLASDELRRWLAQEAPPAPALPDDLDALFDFDELGDGGLVPDRSPHGRDGRAAGPLEVVAGAPGRGRALKLTGDHPVRFEKVGAFRREDPFTIALRVRPAEEHERAVVWHRSRAWTDAGSRGYELLLEDMRPSAALIHFWPGDAVRVRAVDPIPAGTWTHLAVTWDGSGSASGLRILVDGRPVEVETVRDRLTRRVTGGGANALVVGERFRDHGLRGGVVDDLAVASRVLADVEIRALAFPDEPVGADADERRALWLLAHDAAVRSARERVRAARRAYNEAVDRTATIMVMRETATPRPTRRLARGQYDAERELVEPSVPSCLPALARTGPDEVARSPDRLDLAEWLLRPNHPLTARVAVNRFWQMHFGRGLVATPEDFGTQGARPSHPRLLDWLARSFVDSGWDVRALHRTLLTSATWQQDSRRTGTGVATGPDAADGESADPESADPENVLLHRGPSFRLPAEAVRDQALALAGLLVERVGGPPVRPYQPAGLWQEKSGAVYRPSEGEGLWRRSLYTFWKRTSPPPSMMLFDAAKRDVCVARRGRTTTPLQALVLMNDPQFVEAAGRFAERLVREHPSARARVRHAFRACTARWPDEDECAVLEELLAAQHRSFAARPEEARALLEVGASPRDTSLDPVETAATAAVASVLFGLDETVMLR